MKRKLFYVAVSATAAAMIVVLNIAGTIGKNNIVNAAVQGSSVVQKNLSANNEASGKPQVEVPVDLEVEKGDQKNADTGSSPSKLDPVFTAQVFASLKVSPEGIQGDYPVNQEEFKLASSTESEAIVEVNSSRTIQGYGP